jgi:hypothetical protein
VRRLVRKYRNDKNEKAICYKSNYRVNTDDYLGVTGTTNKKIPDDEYRGFINTDSIGEIAAECSYRD